jgi:membrane protease YdiL (CAAX protease family)
MLQIAGARTAWPALAASKAGNLATQGAAPEGGIGAGLLQSAAAWLAYRQDEAAHLSRLLWWSLLERGAEIGAILFIVLQLAGGRCYQLGLTTHRLFRQILAGYLAWLVVTPAVFAVYFAVLLVEPKGSHPFETMMVFHSDLSSWTLLLVSALVVAPFVEELAFRGVFQPWMVKAPETADLTMLIVLISIIVRGTSMVVEGGELPTSWPIILLVGLGSGYLLFEFATRRSLPRPGAARAIYASSVIFASLHSDVWPTPIPLFFLSLGLGTISYRTQSLVAPLVMHMLFNAVTILQMIASHRSGSF